MARCCYESGNALRLQAPVGVNDAGHKFVNRLIEEITKQVLMPKTILNEVEIQEACMARLSSQARAPVLRLDDWPINSRLSRLTHLCGNETPAPRAQAPRGQGAASR